MARCDDFDPVGVNLSSVWADRLLNRGQETDILLSEQSSCASVWCGHKHRLRFGIDRRRRKPLYPAGAFTIARRFTQKKDTGKRLRTNDAIRTSPVRLIGDEDQQIGVVDVQEAKQLAREADLDLVEVAPNSTPPVCRIMDYGKWKYQERKKAQKAKSHSKKSELKEVRLRPAIDEHDLQIKTDRARRFIKEGHKVQFTLMFRGRQNAHKNIGRDLMLEVAAGLGDCSKIETPPRGMGRRMTMIIVPDKTSDDKSSKPKAPKPPKVKAKPKPDAKAEGTPPEAAAPETTAPEATTPTPTQSEETATASN